MEVAVVEGAPFGVREHVPGLLHTCEGFVGEREFVGAGGVQEECQLGVLPAREVSDGGAFGGAEAEDGVEVDGGEDVGDGKDAGGGVGGREAKGEVAARAETAEGEH